MHNPTRRELREEERYLESQLGPDVGRYEAARQRALRDAYRMAEHRYRGEHLMTADYGLRHTLESRGDDGYGQAGAIMEDGPQKRSWLVWVEIRPSRQARNVSTSGR